MRLIYLSPHFDDAALSCGGLIWEQTQHGLPVEAWTVCAGEAPPGPLSQQAENCHRDWGTSSAAETVALRRREDQAAMRILGAAWRHFDIPDCIYRRAPAGEVFYPDRYRGPLHPAEADLDARLAEALAAEIRPGDRLVCPLVVGGHIDHNLTRAAAGRLGLPLTYYAEIPYLLDYADQLEPATTGLVGSVHSISAKGLEAWLNSISAYASQLAPLFKSEIVMRKRMRDYWKNLRGIELWGI